MTKKSAPAISLVETRRGCAVCETEERYDVFLDGKLFGQLWWNILGYCGYLPLPDGTKLSIGEASLSEIRKEVANLNREFVAARSLAAPAEPK